MLRSRYESQPSFCWLTVAVLWRIGLFAIHYISKTCPVHCYTVDICNAAVFPFVLNVCLFLTALMLTMDLVYCCRIHAWLKKCYMYMLWNWPIPPQKVAFDTAKLADIFVYFRFKQTSRWVVTRLGVIPLRCLFILVSTDNDARDCVI